jgi:hypothetical protein
MYPQFEEELKIEHIQGYLYVQQLIENAISANAGSMKMYALTELEETSSSFKKTLVDHVLNRLRFNMKLEDRHFDFFYSNAEFLKFEDWEKSLGHKLETWFADGYLKVSFSAENYRSITDGLSKEDGANWLERRELEMLKINERIKSTKPCISYFIDLLRQHLGTINIDVWELVVSNEMKRNDDYPWHCMNLYWGMSFNFFLLKNNEKLLLLHLGHVIT